MTDRVDPIKHPNWDALMLDDSKASFFHSTAWCRVLAETYGFTPTYFTSTRPAGDLAVLPMMEVRSPLTGHRGVSLPFTDQCTTLCKDHESFAEVFREAVNRGISRGWKYLEFRGESELFEEACPSLSFHGHHLALSSDPMALFARFDSSVRRAIRKAEASQLTVEFSQSAESVREFYGLLSRTRQRHGVPPQPFRFFQSIQQHVLARNLGWVVLARCGATPVAGAVFFHFGNAAIYKYGASHETHQQLRANNLVMWHAIQRCAAQGLSRLDFGRTSLRNDGLRRFKLGWGTTETHINYYKFDLRTRSFVASRDETSRWHNRIFNFLPRPLSQMIGTLLYKHIA